MRAEAYRQQLAGKIAECLRELSRPEFSLPTARLARIAVAQSEFLQPHAVQFDQRVDQRRIIEGHGVLRPEHVCQLSEPVVADCLKFKRDFRVLDPLDELGYLALECERLGMPEICQAENRVCGKSPEQKTWVKS